LEFFNRSGRCAGSNDVNLRKVGCYGMGVLAQVAGKGFGEFYQQSINVYSLGIGGKNFRV
jgi:hypothetical protein